MHPMPIRVPTSPGSCELKMALMEIKLYDDPVLREKARLIAAVEERHRQLGADMAETMYAAHGIGLAANQVGLTERIIVVDVDWPEVDSDDWRDYQPTVMINPEVLEESADDDVYEEGCLSLPEINGEVWRPVSIRYRYTDLDGVTHECEASDLQARCIMHEIDHLDGILFIDRMATEPRRGLAGKLAKLRQSHQG